MSCSMPDVMRRTMIGTGSSTGSVDEHHRPAGLLESGLQGMFIQNLADHSHEEADLAVFAAPWREKVIFSFNIENIQDSPEVNQHIPAASEMNLHASVVVGRLDMHQVAVSTARREVNRRERVRNSGVAHSYRTGYRPSVRRTFDVSEVM